MRRFQQETELMSARWKLEKENHRDKASGTIAPGCHCLRGKGFMRKRRPYDSHSPGKCKLCDIQRLAARNGRRQLRYKLRDEMRFAAE